jgi:hypothetical protein
MTQNDITPAALAGADRGRGISVTGDALDHTTGRDSGPPPTETRGTEGTKGTDLKSLAKFGSLTPESRGNRGNRPAPRLDFAAINRAALSALPALLARWLPGGHYRGAEYVARNPRRADHRPGSFSVNTRTGKWGDFATGDKGGDPISLAAYLSGTGQAEAARALAEMLGVCDD